MAFEQRAVVAKSIAWLNKITSVVINPRDLTAIELTYFNPVNWKFTPGGGNFTTNWIRIYTGEYRTIVDSIKGAPETIKQKAIDNKDKIVADFKSFPNVPPAIEHDYDDIILWGLTIAITKSPNINEQPIIGRNKPVQLELGDSSFGFTLSFLESGPVFWQQNFRNINRLKNLLFSGKPLKMFCPRLKKMIPEIEDIILLDYNLSDDAVYANMQTSLSFTEADTEDIFTLDN